jgi:hypothetical protein
MWDRRGPHRSRTEHAYFLLDKLLCVLFLSEVYIRVSSMGLDYIILTYERIYITTFFQNRSNYPKIVLKNHGKSQ